MNLKRALVLNFMDLFDVRVAVYAMLLTMSVVALSAVSYAAQVELLPTVLLTFLALVSILGIFLGVAGTFGGSRMIADTADRWDAYKDSLMSETWAPGATLRPEDWTGHSTPEDLANLAGSPSYPAHALILARRVPK